jgi:hypothetical protein
VGDRPHPEAGTSQRRNPLTLKQRQIPRPAFLLDHPQRRQTPAFGTPPVAGLARDPNPLARLDRADSSHDQLPVRVLDCQLPLPPRRPKSTPRHVAGVLRQVLEPACVSGSIFTRR